MLYYIDQCGQVITYIVCTIKLSYVYSKPSYHYIGMPHMTHWMLKSCVALFATAF